MKFLHSWIKDFTDVPASPKEAADAATALGFPLDGFEERGQDAVLDLDITTNRPDAMSHTGLARELAAKFSAPFKPSSPIVPQSGKKTSVTIEAPELCPRYCARVIRGVKNGPAPKFIRDRLEAVGQRSINGVVDATNYVLMEMGHPLHAFDLARLKEERIIVREAREDEEIATLDGETRKLRPRMLVIADAANPVALAGVMGGLHSEVELSTRDILLESAYFQPASIRRTSKALALKTEASTRFERGADPLAARTALDRVTEIILEHFGGVVESETDECPRPFESRETWLRFEKMKSFLGRAPGLTIEWTRALLERLGFEILSQEGGTLHLRVPSWRGDIEREADVIEEVARHFGYEKIEPVLPAYTTQAESGLPRETRLAREIRASLTASGFREAVTYSFVHPEREVALGADHDSLLRLSNPMSEEMSVLRQSLYQGLLDSLAYNAHRGVRDARFFEYGKIFLSPQTEDEHAREIYAVAGVARGARAPRQWSEPPSSVNYFDARGAVETLAARLRIAGLTFRGAKSPRYHPYRCAEIFLDGNLAGECGELSERVLRAWDIEGPVAAFHLQLPIFAEHAWPAVAFAPVPKWNPLRRDMAFFADETLAFAQVDAILKASDWPHVSAVRLVDVYHGEKAPAGKKSFALEVEFQPKEKNLTEADVAATLREMATRLRHELGMELRGSL